MGKNNILSWPQNKGQVSDSMCSWFYFSPAAVCLHQSVILISCLQQGLPDICGIRLGSSHPACHRPTWRSRFCADWEVCIPPQPRHSLSRCGVKGPGVFMDGPCPTLHCFSQDPQFVIRNRSDLQTRGAAFVFLLQHYYSLFKQQRRSIYHGGCENSSTVPFA